MFREKDFLLEKGLSRRCREDTTQLVGQFYDDQIKNNKINEKFFREKVDYLDSHRELIGNVKYKIISYESFIVRLQTDFGGTIEEDLLKRIKTMCPNSKIEPKKVIIKKEEESIKIKKVKEEYSIEQQKILDMIKKSEKELKESIQHSGQKRTNFKSVIKNIKTPIEKKHGVYGIYLGDILLYIGETTVDFKTRFQQHKNGLKNQTTDLYIRMKKIIEKYPDKRLRSE